MRDLRLDEDVEAALGGSRLIAEELRGDLAVARVAADRALEEARAAGGGRRLARATAQAGAVTLLQGEPTAAIPLLADSLAAAPRGPDAETVATLVGLAFFSDRFLLADGAEADSLTLLLRAMRQAQEPGFAGRDPGFVGALAKARREVRATRADAAGALRRVRAATPPGWDAYATLAVADLAWRAGRARDAERRLARARARYERAHDAAGVALCDLTLADWRLAPRASSVTWGVVLREAGPGKAPTPDHDAGPADLDGAHAALARARAGFEAAAAPRGIAATALREGFLAALVGDPEQGETLALGAQAQFDAAGDRAGARLAGAHACLAGVAAGRPVWPDGAAREIGAWGAGAGSFAFTCGLGLQFAGAGRRWRTDGEVDAALAAQRLAEQLFRALGDGFGTVDALAERADLHAFVGDAGTARDLLEEASGIATELLGIFPVAERDPALTRATSAAEVLRDIVHTLEDADGLERLGAHLGPLRAAVVERARIHAPEAVPALERTYAEADADDAVTIDVYRAWRALERDAPADYESFVAAALATATAAGPRLERLVHQAVHDLEPARDAFRRALDADPLSAPAGRRRLRADLTAAVQVEDWTVARERVDALVAEDGTDWWELDEESWHGLDDDAAVLAAEHQWAPALRRHEDALARVERRRPPVGRSAQRAEEASASNVAVRAGRTCLLAASAGHAARQELWRRAFTALEGRKARRLLDRAGSGAAAAVPGGSSDPDARRWRRLSARADEARERLRHAKGQEDTAAERAELERLEAALATLEATLRERDSRWLAVLCPQIPVPELSEVVDALPEHTALLHYTIADNELIAFAVTSGGIAAAHREAHGDRRLAAEIARFRVLCGAGTSRRWEGIGERLGDLLLGPFGSVLDDHAQLWIVPSQAAHGLPFGALLRGGEPLLASHDLSYLPSAAFATVLGRAARPLDAPALFVGDPAGMAWPGRRDADGAPAANGNALPWAAAEAAAGAGMLGVEPLLGAAATEAELRARLAAQRHGLAYLATHGALEDPALASVLLLAEGQWLSVLEVLGMGLDAELVVLSACESGRSVVKPGDEIQGFGAAVLSAGARAAVVTLWEVSDGGTALLMLELVERLARGEAPRAALAGAQRHLRTLKPAAAAEAVARLRVAADEAGRPVPLPPGVRDPPADLSHPKYSAPFVLLGR